MKRNQKYLNQNQTNWNPNQINANWNQHYQNPFNWNQSNTNNSNNSNSGSNFCWNNEQSAMPTKRQKLVHETQQNQPPSTQLSVAPTQQQFFAQAMQPSQRPMFNIDRFRSLAGNFGNLTRGLSFNSRTFASRIKHKQITSTFLVFILPTFHPMAAKHANKRINATVSKYALEQLSNFGLSATVNVELSDTIASLVKRSLQKAGQFHTTLQGDFVQPSLYKLCELTSAANAVSQSIQSFEFQHDDNWAQSIAALKNNLKVSPTNNRTVRLFLCTRAPHSFLNKLCFENSKHLSELFFNLTAEMVASGWHPGGVYDRDDTLWVCRAYPKCQCNGKANVKCPNGVSLRELIYENESSSESGYYLNKQNQSTETFETDMSCDINLRTELQRAESWSEKAAVINQFTSKEASLFKFVSQGSDIDDFVELIKEISNYYNTNPTAYVFDFASSSYKLYSFWEQFEKTCYFTAQGILIKERKQLSDAGAYFALAKFSVCCVGREMCSPLFLHRLYKDCVLGGGDAKLVYFNTFLEKGEDKALKILLGDDTTTDVLCDEESKSADSELCKWPQCANIQWNDVVVQEHSEKCWKKGLKTADFDLMGISLEDLEDCTSRLEMKLKIADILWLKNHRANKQFINGIYAACDKDNINSSSTNWLKHKYFVSKDEWSDKDIKQYLAADDGTDEVLAKIFVAFTRAKPLDLNYFLKWCTGFNKAHDLKIRLKVDENTKEEKVKVQQEDNVYTILVPQAFTAKVKGKKEEECVALFADLVTNSIK